MASFFTDNYIKLDSTTSTNNFAYNLLKSGKIKEGTIVTTLYQSKGQGQMGAKWESEHGKNILMSIVLSPDILLKNQFHLNICISLALHDFAKKYFKKEPKIKWPNDLLVDRKKLAGILIKNIVKSSTIKDAIVGIGLNVNQIKFKNYSLKATSMKELLEKELDIEELQKELLDCIELRYLQLKRKEFVKIREEYSAVLYGFNQWRYYEIEGGKIKAKIIGIDEFGILLLEMENGKIKSFSLKEISFLF
jgi:BirA family biotin operon repressor/biotin-[acetyl-CoA-carboxylase] ligase